MLKQKRVQKSIHIGEDLEAIIHQRGAISNRGFSREVEYMLRQLLEIQAKENQQALTLASRPLQGSQELPASDGLLYGPQATA